MLLEQSVEDGGLADLKVTTLDTSVVNTEDHVDVLHRLCSNVGELLDLGSSVLDLYIICQLKYDILIKNNTYLFVVKLKIELLDSALNGVPTGQSVTDRDVSSHTKVGGVEDLVGGRVGKDGLGMDTSLVGEGTETSDVVVAGQQIISFYNTDRIGMNLQRDLNLNGLGNEIFELSEHREVVLALNILRVGNHHSGNKTAKRGDTISLANTELKPC